MSNNNDNNILLYTALIASLGSLLTSFYTHIKHSKCLGVELDTRTQPATPNRLTMSTLGETTHLVTPSAINTVARGIMNPAINTTASAPILIPKPPPPPKNYL